MPQGSILGLLFFIIYVNDLVRLFPEDGVKITLYTDDTVLYVSHRDPPTAALLLEEGLHSLSGWCVENKLTINVKKIKHMILTPMNYAGGSIRVSLNGEPLDIVHSYNYLGVKIDNNLTLDSLLKEKGNKVNIRIFQLCKLPKYITKYVANLIYKQTILPVVEYANQLVESGPADKIERLQTLQDKAVHSIDNREYPGMDKAILSNLYRMSPLKERRAEHLSAIMYRLSKDESLLEISRPEIHLRNRNKIKFKTYNRVHE